MKIDRYIILFSLFITLISGSCKKDPIDFRDRYTGEWYFETEYYYFTISDSYYDTIYNYQGKIWYDTTDRINIEFRENNVIESIVNINGEISDNQLYDNNVFSGEFTDENNISIELKTIGNGYSITQIINGTR